MTQEYKTGSIMACILSIALIPLLIIFIVYISGDNSHILQKIYVECRNLPNITSFHLPTISIAMSTYCKLAPVFGFILFILSYKKANIHGLSKARNLNSAFLVLIILYSTMVYLFMLNNFELTNSSRALNIISENEYSLFLFFALIFFSLYFFSHCLFCFILAYVYRLIYKHQH